MTKTARFKPALPALLLTLGLAACQPEARSPAPSAEPVTPAAPVVVGGDRDAHGCIGSAGYTWCERTASCIRPWELAKQEGIANTPEAVAGYCAGR